MGSRKKGKKNLPLFAAKLTEELPDCCNAKEHYQLFPRKKHKVGRTLRNNYSTIKTYRKSKYC